jgi:cytochrome c5
MNDRARVNGQSGIKESVRYCAMLVALAAIIPFGALAQGGNKTGAQVVAVACGKCHTTGEKNAPKIGDKAAWGKLAAQGLTGLTAVALKGIREMPAHGGSPGLSDTEIARAITYMVNKSGGKWIEPTNKTKPAGPMTGEQIVKMQCYQCHEQGIDGAPKIGDAGVDSAAEKRTGCDGALGGKRARRDAGARRHGKRYDAQHHHLHVRKAEPPARAERRARAGVQRPQRFAQAAPAGARPAGSRSRSAPRSKA